MSIKAIAQELYKCQAKVHVLEDQLADTSERPAPQLQEQLRLARAELKVLKNMLEGRKAQATTMQKKFGYR